MLIAGIFDNLDGNKIMLLALGALGLYLARNGALDGINHALSYLKLKVVPLDTPDPTPDPNVPPVEPNTPADFIKKIIQNIVLPLLLKGDKVGAMKAMEVLECQSCKHDAKAA